ncbi:MAG: response regulator, partial [Halobacteriota archaeon]
MEDRSGSEIDVLYVDDDGEYRDVASSHVESLSSAITVSGVGSVEQGLRSLEDREHDCVVSDYEMPGADGLDFLRKVRERYPDLPFVLYTARGSEEVAGEAISMGVTDYVQKKAGRDHYEVLVNRVERSVAAYHDRNKLRRSQALASQTEAIADAGGWEADLESGLVRLTEGARLLLDAESPSEADDLLSGFTEADERLLREECERASAERGEIDVEVEAPDGDTCYRVIAEAVDDDGSPRIRGSIRDVSQRRRRLNKLERQNSMLETL